MFWSILKTCMSQSSRCQTLLQHWKIPKKFIIKIFESVHSRQIVHSLWILLVQFQIIPAPGSLLFHGTQTSQHQWVSVGAAVQRNKYLKIKWCRWVSSWKLRWTIQMNRYCRKIGLNILVLALINPQHSQQGNGMGQIFYNMPAHFNS